MIQQKLVLESVLAQVCGRHREWAGTVGRRQDGGSGGGRGGGGGRRGGGGVGGGGKDGVEGKVVRCVRTDRDKKSSTLLDLCVSSLRRGHANLLCIVPILTDVPRKESK